MDTQIYQPILQLSFKDTPDNMAGMRNIASTMSEEDREALGAWCLQGYKDDKTSRLKWEAWYADAIKLALQVKETKTFPWPNCSNVKFPLLTIAALNAHAQAYPAIIPGDNVVKGKVIGDDPEGIKHDRAERIGKHMSFQLMETMPWEEQTDKQLLVHYIMGTTFKKTYRDNTRRCNASDLVMPQDLIVNYFAKDMETAPRASHWFPLTKNELWENINAQVYLKPDEPLRTEARPTGPLEAARDKAQMVQAPPIMGLVNYIIEQSCWLDLDQDGYDEPYAVTFDEATGYVYRIHARYLTRDIKRGKSGVIKIHAENYYTKFTLIPSPDGGFYGMGLGRFLAPINDAVDTVLNQMIDAITMSILGGGFLGRGVRMKAGEAAFRPYEYKPTDSTGDDIRKNVLPLPVRDVPPVALDLLRYLVEYGERIGSSGDIQMGKIPGQNVKAQTATIANENGKLIFNSTFKRFWRGLKEEFRKLYRLNQLYQGDETFQLGEKHYRITSADYNYPEAGVIPAADPNVVSRTEKKNTAMVVLQTAQSMGGAGHDMEKVIIRFYEAHDVPSIESIFPGFAKMPPQPGKEAIEAQIKGQREQTRRLDITQKNQIAVAELMLKIRKGNAEILQLTAESAKLIKEAQGIDIGHQIALLQLKIHSEIERRDDALQVVEMLMSSIKEDSNADQAAQSSGMGGVATSPGNGGASALSAATALSSAGGLGA